MALAVVHAELHTRWRDNPLALSELRPLLVDARQWRRAAVAAATFGVVCDGHEYCGCFVVLRGGGYRSGGGEGGSLVVVVTDGTFDDSEQKLFTRFLTEPGGGWVAARSTQEST
jgi:hypothetical protein